MRGQAGARADGGEGRRVRGQAGAGAGGCGGGWVHGVQGRTGARADGCMGCEGRRARRADGREGRRVHREALGVPPATLPHGIRVELPRASANSHLCWDWLIRPETGSSFGDRDIPKSPVTMKVSFGQFLDLLERKVESLRVKFM